MKRILMSALIFFFSFLIPAAQNTAEGSEGYAGIDACKGCHEEKYESFAKSSHGVKADPRTPAAWQGCESCHGAGDAHVNAGGGRGVGGIVPLGAKSATSPGKKSAPCLGCHSKGKIAMWPGSTHDEKGVSCSDCHSIHGGKYKNLAKATQTEVCNTCHLQVKSQIQKSSHHPIREGKVSCSDCHNPHGTIADGLIAANTVNEKCWECHAEKRGPFLWEHAPAVEDCLTCHTPHGSSHDKLLAAKRPYLCQRCHSNSRHPGTLYGLFAGETGNVYQFESTRIFESSCQNCHSQIHGSNHPSGKSLLR